MSCSLRSDLIIGLPLTIRYVAIVMLGGSGSLIGSLVGGLILGVAETFAGFFLGAHWSLAVAFFTSGSGSTLEARGVVQTCLRDGLPLLTDSGSWCLSAFAFAQIHRSVLGRISSSSLHVHRDWSQLQYHGGLPGLCQPGPLRLFWDQRLRVFNPLCQRSSLRLLPGDRGVGDADLCDPDQLPVS